MDRQNPNSGSTVDCLAFRQSVVQNSVRHPQLLLHLRPELAEMTDVPGVDGLRFGLERATGDERIINRAAYYPHLGILGDGREMLLGRQGDRGEARLDVRDK